MIESLTEQVTKLKSTIAAQNGKISQLTEELEKKKKEINNLKKSLALRKASQHGKPEQQMELEVVPGKAPPRAATPEPKSQAALSDTHANLLEVARNLKSRNALLEKEILDLKKQLDQKSHTSSLPPAIPSGKSNHVRYAGSVIFFLFFISHPLL
jgi:cell division protein FtsB